MLVLADDEMLHYGVLGMKWGVRHDKPSSGGGGTRKSKKATASVTKSTAKRGNMSQQQMIWQTQQQAITDANRNMSLAVSTSIPGMPATPFMFGGKNETPEERKARHKEAAKKVAKVAAGIAATVALSYVSVKVATSPKLRSFVAKKVINKDTAEDLARIIADAGPEIVKKSATQTVKTTSAATSTAKATANQTAKVAKAAANSRITLDSQVANNQRLIEEYRKRRR